MLCTPWEISPIYLSINISLLTSSQSQLQLHLHICHTYMLQHLDNYVIEHFWFTGERSRSSYVISATKSVDLTDICSIIIIQNIQINKICLTINNTNPRLLKVSQLFISWWYKEQNIWLNHFLWAHYSLKIPIYRTPS